MNKKFIKNTKKNIIIRIMDLKKKHYLNKFEYRKCLNLAVALNSKIPFADRKPASNIEVANLK